jgi:hypothetical protein
MPASPLLRPCLAPRQIDHRDVVATRRIAGQGAAAARFRMIRMAPNADDVQLAGGGGCAVDYSGYSGYNRRGHGQEAFSSGHMGIGYGYHIAGQ